MGSDARGEGLAGLVAKWRADAAKGKAKAAKLKLPTQDTKELTEYDTALEHCATELETALEAAARLPAAKPGLRELIEELTPMVDFYLKREIDSPSNHQEFAREASKKLDKWYELASIVPSSPKAALATPAPQAPREQFEYACKRCSGSGGFGGLQCPDCKGEKKLIGLRAPAATQEPAGSGADKPVRLEQPLRKLREIAGELDAASYVTGQKATAKLIRQCVDEIIGLTLYEQFGSPRKVGEDGPSETGERK